MTSSWDDVGRQFAELGRSLQAAWEDAWSSDAGAPLKDAGDRVSAAVDDLAATVNRVAGSPELRDTVRSAGTGVADAIASTLHTVADLIASTAPRADEPRQEDAVPDDAPPSNGSNGSNGSANGTADDD